MNDEKAINFRVLYEYISTVKQIKDKDNRCFYNLENKHRNKKIIYSIKPLNFIFL